MNRNTMAWLIPPAAVYRHGCATSTSAPIGVFWLASLVSLIYGLLGGKLGNVEGTQWVLVGLGIVMWIIAAVWARLVIQEVNEDLNPHQQGSLNRRVVPKPDEPDPFSEVSKH